MGLFGTGTSIVSELRAELSDLREEKRQLLEENRRLVDRILALTQPAALRHVHAVETPPHGGDPEVGEALTRTREAVTPRGFWPGRDRVPRPPARPPVIEALPPAAGDDE